MKEAYYTTLSPETEIEQWTLLFYGQSGTGKTRTAAQMKDRNGLGPLFLSFERGKYGGLASAKQYSPKQIVVKNYSEITPLYSILEEKANKDFGIIVVDSVTALQKITMTSILHTSGRETPGGGWGGDWSLCQERVRTILNKIANLGCHVVYIATEQRLKDDKSGKISGLPNVPGKLAEELPAGVDLCLHFSSEVSVSATGAREVNYYMATAPDGTWSAKDCSTTLPIECKTKAGDEAFAHLKHLFTKEKT